VFRERKLSFAQFVDKIASNNTVETNPEGLHRNTNPHWRPQLCVVLRCAVLLANLRVDSPFPAPRNPAPRYMFDLERYLPAYNFVGSFAHVETHVRLLLQGLDLWDGYGQSGWGRGGKTAIFERNSAVHRTGTGDKMAEYYTPELLAKVKAAYGMDYAMFKAIGVGGVPTDGRRWTPPETLVASNLKPPPRPKKKKEDPVSPEAQKERGDEEKRLAQKRKADDAKQRRDERAALMELALAKRSGHQFGGDEARRAQAVQLALAGRRKNGASARPGRGVRRRV
jgi:hypothetical protein